MPTHPYGVRALPWDPRHANAALFAEDAFRPRVRSGRQPLCVARGGDARALDRRLRGRPQPARKNWLVDELRPYPDQPAAWGDMVATLVDGPAPAPFSHCGLAAAGRRALRRCPRSPMRCCTSAPARRSSCGPPERWAALAGWLAARGITPVWSAAAARRTSSAPAIPTGRFASFAGRLDLAQLWRLLRAARELLVAPDTGVAHLARIVGAPTVALFGPGSAVIDGRRRLLARRALSRGDGRPVPVPRPAHPVPPRDRLGAPLRAHAGAMRRSRAACTRSIARRRDRCRDRARRASAMTARPDDRPDQSRRRRWAAPKSTPHS